MKDMSRTFRQYAADELEELATFLATERWPFHVQAECAPEATRKHAAEGYFDGKGVESHWILDEEGERLGFVRIYDLADDNPLFDLRIAESRRGQGIGTEAVEWLKEHVFSRYANVNRLEGYTRRDNVGMRKVFRKAGFVKESQPRACWPDDSGTLHDSVGYAMTRHDWETGSTTPVDWEEE